MHAWKQYGIMVLRVVILLGAGSAAQGVERTMSLEAPASVAAGAACLVVLSAGTDAGQGEKIGLLQTDISVDGGRTWTGLCYLNDLGENTRQERTVTAGAAGSTIKVRMRVAFRHGLAGDVDHAGAALRWNGSWARWQEPPAKSVTVTVR